MSVRHALLALLREGPKYGLQLRQEFEERTGEVWPLNVGQVYTTLQRLERDGLVESDDESGEGARKAFRLTAAGDVELVDWLRTPSVDSPPRDELVIKVMVALRVPGVDVAEVIQSHRRHLIELMQQHTRLKEHAGDDAGLALVVDSELFRLDAAVRWLDTVDGRMKREPSLTAPAGRAGARHETEEPPEDRGPSMTVLELRDVSKVYGTGAAEVHALAHIDLLVEPGDLVAVMGPSGSGKSTLLTIAGSLEDPTGGEVLVDGERVAAMSRDDRARLRRRAVGYVFQDYNLLAGLTAAENVALPLELDRTHQRAARRAALEVMEQLGVADRADRYPDDLSGGERQRVAIARAIVGDRHLLLTDEPTGALDSVSGEAVMRLVREACGRGVAGVVVTHDAQLASWADRVVFLRDGHVVDRTAPTPGPESLLVGGSGR